MQKKYMTIYQDLVKKISDNEWAEQSLLPSENEMTEAYSTSRETIRKALNLLAQDGYIQKIRGKGSVVINMNKFDFPVSGIVSFKELAAKLQVTTRTVVHELGLAVAAEKLQQLLQLKQSEKVWSVTRTRIIDGEKVILDKDFLNASVVPSITEAICEDSIYSYLESDLGLKISFARKEIVVEEPTAEDREYLDLEGFSNIVVIKSLVYLDDASLFQYTESRHRPDKFRFVDFARRINK
ncbi:trehalose operon repressor [Virgibacillus flavescens]|uniref:trehalose operon repressor n=1 Tax=Virgibacillus flavescens TaxID=1611422 RepID=UPI003D32E94C